MIFHGEALLLTIPMTMTTTMMIAMLMSLFARPVVKVVVCRVSMRSSEFEGSLDYCA